MKKMVVFVKKRKDVTMEQFKDHIRNKHIVIEEKICKVSPWVKLETRNFLIPSPIPEIFPDGKEEKLFDAMFEIWIDPEYKGELFDLSPEAQKFMGELFKDEENFIDISLGRVPPNYIVYWMEEEPIYKK